MKLGSKVPLPEMDELRVARLERAVVADQEALPQMRGAFGLSLARLAVAGLAIAGVVFAIALNLRGAGEPEIRVVTASQSAPQPTEVRTGPGQTSQLLLGDAEVTVGENTELIVRRFVDGRTLLTLNAGHVHCEVQPRENRPVFQVVSDDVTVTVIGTAFDVIRSRIVEVKVERGIVGVTTANENAEVHAGESWQGSPHADQRLSAILATIAQEEKVARDAELASVPTPKVPWRKRRHVAKTPKQSKIPEEVVTTVSQIKRAKPLAPNFTSVNSERLVHLKSVFANDPAKAVQELSAVAASSTGRTASFALYSRAYLLLFKLRQPSKAAKAVEQYSRRFPRGAEAEDMLWLGVQSRCKSGVSPRCRSAAHSYLLRFAGGRFGTLASKIVNTSEE